MRLLLCSVGLAVCPVLAVCQRPVPAKLSLADAIALARANSPVYRQVINDRAPAAWAVRSAWSTLLVPSVSASGGIGYAGPGQQTFLTSNFSQSVSTLSSSYSIGLDWSLSGQTLTQPGLRKAQLSAADADVAGAETNLVTTVTQQYLTVLQARDNAEVARQQLQHDEEGQKLAQARHDGGREAWGDGPSLSLSAGWSGFTQQLADIDPTIASARASAAADSTTCAYANSAWLNGGSGQPPLDCTQYSFSPAAEQAIRSRNAAYPFHFTPEPFQARLTVRIPLWGNFQQPLEVSQAKDQQQNLQESVRARGLQLRTDVNG